MTDNSVPYESLNWFKVFVKHPNIDGEIEMTITDKGETSLEALRKSLASLDYLVSLTELEESTYGVRGPFMAQPKTAIQSPTEKPQQTSDASNNNQASQQFGDKPTSGSFELDKLVIEPRPDGRVNMRYYAKGLKWPVVTSVRSKDQATTIINGVFNDQAVSLGLSIGPNEMNQVKEYAFHGTVHWKNSERLTSAGNPYKDIVNIEV